MLICPKKDLQISSGLTVGMKGFLRLQCINKFSGKVTQDTNWFPNTLLDAGRNIMATESSWLTSCQVGTDNTAPSAAQAALLGYVAGTSDIRSTDEGNQVTVSPYYGWKRLVYRFAVGTVAANLTEVGVGWGTTGSTLISRALIRDPILGTPTTITPLADEFLEVTYELRYYPPVADVTSPSVTLDSIVYDTITRGAEVNSQYWIDYIGTAIGYLASDWLAYDGSIGTLLQNPSGTSAGGGTPLFYNETYQSNSYAQVMSITVPWDSWNLGAGIRSVRIRTTAGSFQTEFTSNPGNTTIPKTNLYNMIMKWKLTWAAL